MNGRTPVLIFIGSIMVGLVGVGLVVKKVGPDPKRRPEVKDLGVTYAAKPAEAASPWEYDQAEDPMGRGTRKSAISRSLNTVELDFPYRGPQHASLVLRRDHQGLNIMVEIERGQILFGYDGTHVNVRFDQGKTAIYSVSRPSDHSTTVMFISSEAAFMERLRQAKTLQVEVPTFRNGSPVFTFDVAGLKTDF